MDHSDFFNEFDLGDGEYLNSYEDSAADLKFRAIKVDNFSHNDYFPSSSYAGAPAMSMCSQFINKFVETGPVKQNNDDMCPVLPRGISNKNFIINNQDYATVVRMISEFLVNYNDNFDFSYVPSEHMWRGKYLNGSNCFEVDVNVYTSGPNGFTVTVRICKCECSCCGTFNEFFNAMKNKLSTDAAAKGPVRKPFVIPTMNAGLLPPVSAEEFLEGIKPIFCMAKGCWESRVQASKMLCDVSRKNASYLELPTFRVECARALEAFLGDECHEVRQYAIVAIAAFVELPVYHELFLRSRILSALFVLIENPVDATISYETAQVRRLAAASLAHLSRHHAYAVRAGLHQQQCDVTHWMAHTVPNLIDSRTRAYALIIKSELEQVHEDSMPVSTSDEFPLHSSSCGGEAGGCSGIEDESSPFTELVR